jgi:serine/threonine-protein kinase
MKPERRRQVEALFEEALERDVSDRAKLLDRFCADDAELRAEVESLLAAHDRAQGVLESDPAAAAANAVRESSVGERIGRYCILSEVGRGGMGVVYLAESDDAAFRRKVAVKVIPGGPGMSELHRRFEAERRILASLDHPHIARLLDGGITEDGRQYLVMEHVDGLPIDEYCDRNRLNVDDRLRLFCTVARAVHYAHRNLVVHRDLKPSNILVTDEGVVKLLDFGIAKMLDPAALGHSAPLTRTGLRLMTPEYASPEQVQGDLITTATDVYGLGVVLFELLTGRVPFQLTKRSPYEWERIILEEEPPKPSAAVVPPKQAKPKGDTTEHDGRAQLDGDPRAHLMGSSGGESEAHRFAYRTRANYLRRRLRGDVDNIVCMALRKEPARRYASAEQVASDVERHLDGDPVDARGDSAMYRTRKFVARHRLMMGAAAAIVLSLGGGLVATTWQAREAAEQAAIASAQRDRAARVAGMMVEVFRLTDPNEALGDSISARQILDRGIQRVMDELADQPDVQSAMLLEVARVYEHLGLFERAEETVLRSLVLREEYYGSPSLEVSESASRLGELLAAQGRREEAIEQFRRAIAIRESALDGPDSLLAATWASLAFELRNAADYDEAAGLFQAAVEAQRALPGSEVTVAATLLGLAATYHDQGAFNEAEALFESTLEGYDASQPHPMAASALLNVGMIRRLREQYASAEPLVKAAYDMRIALYENDHPDVIEAMAQWGLLLWRLGRYGEAEPILRAGLERANGKLGPQHLTSTTLREALATIELEMGRYAEASARFDTALAAKRGRHDGDHAGIVVSLIRSADPLVETGRLRGAGVFLDSALAMSQRLSGLESIYGMLAQQRMAGVALRRGRLGEAERLLDAAQAVAVERLRENHRYTLQVRSDQAAVLLRRGRAEEAVALLLGVLAAERAKLAEPHPRIGYTLQCLGEAYLALGLAERADAVLREAERNLAELPAGHWRHGEVLSLRGAALRAQGRSGEPETQWLLDEGLRVITAHLGADAPEARRAAARLGG